MFELKITTETAAEARQALEQVLGIQVIPGQLLTMDTGDQDLFDATVEKRIAEIDAQVKKDIQEMHAENRAQAKTIEDLTAQLDKYQGAAIEAQLAKQDAPDNKEVKRSHKAKAKDTEAPPWIPEAAPEPGEPVQADTTAIDGATVRRALADLVEAKGRAALEKVLADFQADKFSKLDPDRFGEVLQAVAEVMK